jgi:hypothetical protein
MRGTRHRNGPIYRGKTVAHPLHEICGAYLGADSEIAPELTGHGLPLVKCEAYNRVYDQPYGSS